MEIRFEGLSASTAQMPNSPTFRPIAFDVAGLRILGGFVLIGRSLANLSSPSGNRAHCGTGSNATCFRILGASGEDLIRGVVYERQEMVSSSCIANVRLTPCYG